MLPLRYSTGWRVAGVVLLLLVLAATLAPAIWFFSSTRELVTWVTNIDKWLHAITFLFLTIWFAGQYRRGAYWRIALGLTLFGILIELCQRMVSYRSAEWLDLAANVGGIVVGLILAGVWLGGWSLRLEQWWLQRAGVGGD